MVADLVDWINKKMVLTVQRRRRATPANLRQVNHHFDKRVHRFSPATSHSDKHKIIVCISAEDGLF